MANTYDESLIPELGDFVTFISDVHKTTSGIIIFRDGELIRIRPVNSTAVAVDFPLNAATGLFQESLGVSQVVIHEKRTDPHFSKQLGVLRGELLELVDAEGHILETVGVEELIATKETDAVRLTDGRVLDFGFVGPAPPIVRINPRAAAEAVATAENNAALNIVEETQVEEVFPEIDLTLLPASLVEEIPSEERIYSDSVQREDMFISLLTDHPASRQKDPKVMARLYRTTDLLMALKNSVLLRDAQGAPTGEKVKYTVNTLQEALAAQTTGAPLGSLLPVAAVKKNLYADVEETMSAEDVIVSNDVKSLLDALTAANTFNVDSEQGNPFITYIHSLMEATAAFTEKEAKTKTIMVDQDVLRTRAPPAAVQGFPSTGAAFDKKGEAIELGTNALGDVDKRMARLLSSSTIRVAKTNTTYTVAPGDTATVASFLLLSPELSLRRGPTRSGNLLWDIQRSELNRAASKSFYAALKSAFDAQRTVEVDGADPLLDELQERLQTSVQFANRGLLSVLDNFGLANLELNDELFQPIAASVKDGQKVWKGAYVALGKAAIARLSVPSVPVFGPVSDALFTTDLMASADLAPFFAEVAARESSLKTSDLLLAQEITSTAAGTLYPFVYSIASGAPSDQLKQIWSNESARAKRMIENTREAAKLLQAAPEINKCVHVQELEKIRSVRDDSKRMVLFEKFMKKFSAGQEGNNIQCSNCAKTLVCKHEILLLNEYLNPGRSAALHKALLLEFAGPVFEGAYICKNCGQKIRDLEYDTHLEFDDEGRPLMGRSVIEPEEDDSGVVIAAEADSEIPFTGAERGMYFTVRTLFELCGLAVDLDVYRRVVKTLSTYYNSKSGAVPETTYKANQELLKARAAKDGKRFVEIPYSKYAATELIKGCAALTVLELQTNPIAVPIAAPGCKLSRSGFPLEGVAGAPEAGYDIKALATGCIDYVACALASIVRLNEPWSQLMWSTETDMKRRTEFSRMATLQGLSKILCIRFVGLPAPLPIEDVATTYNALLDTARARAAAVVGATNVSLASSSDKLPSAFRPAARIVVEESSAPIANVGKYKAAVETASAEVVEATAIRFADLLGVVLAQFHVKAAVSGVVQTNNPCSESVCCAMRLAVYNEQGNGIATIGLADGVLAELQLVGAAFEGLRRRDNAKPNSGTHIYVPWKAPLVTNVLPTPDASTYYKLFLKNCHAGRRYGAPHEYNEEYVCRNCNFHMPEELVYLIPALISEANPKKYEAAVEAQLKERERLALGAFAAQGVIINEESFQLMENKMKEKRLIAPSVPVEIRAFLDILQNRIPSLLVGSDAKISADYELLVGAMLAIERGKLTGMGRLGPIRGFAQRYQEISTSLRDRLSTLVGTSRLEEALAGFDVITQKGSYHTIVSSLNNLFVVGASQIANGYTLKSIPVYKWFPKVNENHRQTLLKIWETFGSITKTTQEGMDEISEEAKPVIQLALKRFSAFLGPLLKIFLLELRPTIGFTPDEYTLVLRWVVKSALLSLVNIDNIWYGDSPSSSVSAEACGFIAGWIRNTMATGGSYTRKYMLSDEEIRSKVNARVEQEKNMFIAKMDRQEQEMRKLELVKKKLKIGDWAVGSQNLFRYNADMYEFERAQRAAMGVPEFADDIVGPTAEADTDTPLFAAAEPGMEEGVLHRAAQDEDETTDIGQIGRFHIVC